MKRIDIRHFVFGFLLVSSLFYFFSYPEVDPDLWGHLFFGREILWSGRLPVHNLYSYTAPDQVWINHEWLAEVIFYSIYHFFGAPGLILLKVILGAGVIWILDLVIRQRVPSFLVRMITLIWIMAILSPGFNIRPQLFTYLFFATFLFLFYRYEGGNKNSLYLAACLFVPWVNLHGGFVAGNAALGLFTFWTAVHEWWNGRATRSVISYILVPFIPSLLFLLLNPYGLDLLSFLARDLLPDRPITEWEMIPLLDLSFIEFKLALVAVFVLGLWSGSWRRWDFVLVFLAALFSVRYQRHMPLFAIAAAPFLAQGVEKVNHWIEGRAREWVLALGIVAVALWQLHWMGGIHLQHRFQLVMSREEYPIQAVDFLRRNGVRGNLAVPFDWGEYLIWKLYPEVRVSVDGRYTTAYPMEVIQDSWEWMRGGKGWKRLLERYPTEIALTNRYHPVTALLRKDPEWVYIYSDPIAFIFVRKTPSQENLLGKFKGKRLLPPQPPPIYFPG